MLSRRMFVMPRFLRCLTLVVLLTLFPSMPVFANQLFIEGSGWGHGLGLSQYGAKAMAIDGVSYEKIVSNYFPETSVTPYESVTGGTFFETKNKPLWVGLRQNSQDISFVVEKGKAELCFDFSNYCVATANPDEKWSFTLDGTGNCVFLIRKDSGNFRMTSQTSRCSASVRPISKDTIIRIPYKARSYKDGTLRIRQSPETMKLQIIYEIGVEDFMRGLSEVPESWPQEAIKAQAVVSRSQTVWKALDRGSFESFDTKLKNDCYCNIWDNTNDQIFRGYTGEETHPKWVDAVESTSKEILNYRGSIALGMHFSSSAGRTENYSDVFDSNEHPYLKSVNDQAAFLEKASNPHTNWTASYMSASLAEIFGFDSLVDMKATKLNESGSVKELKLTGLIEAKQSEKFFSGVEVRNALSLRSTFFRITNFLRFDDVTENHPFAGEILALDELAITKGCTLSQFCPEKKVTRGEMAAFLVRALNLPQIENSDPYVDDDGHVFESEITTLSAYGITKGCTLSQFCPEKEVTRGEMAAFLVRALS